MSPPVLAGGITTANAVRAPDTTSSSAMAPATRVRCPFFFGHRRRRAAWVNLFIDSTSDWVIAWGWLAVRLQSTQASTRE
jgi:hypothetical protein